MTYTDLMLIIMTILALLWIANLEPKGNYLLSSVMMGMLWGVCWLIWRLGGWISLALSM